MKVITLRHMSLCSMLLLVIQLVLWHAVHGQIQQGLTLNGQAKWSSNALRRTKSGKGSKGSKSGKGGEPQPNPGYCALDSPDLEFLGDVMTSTQDEVSIFLDTRGDAVSQLTTFLDLVRIYLPTEIEEMTTDEDIISAMALQNDDSIGDNRQLLNGDALDNPECIAALLGFAEAALSQVLSYVGIRSNVASRIAGVLMTQLVKRRPNVLKRLFRVIESALSSGSSAAPSFANGVIFVALEAFYSFSLNGILGFISQAVPWYEFALIGVTIAAQLTAIFLSGGVVLTLRILNIIGNASGFAGFVLAIDALFEKCLESNSPTNTPTTESPVTVVPTPPTEDREDVTCPSTQVSGGAGVTRFNVDILASAGTFPISYQMYQIPDGLTIEYEGQLLFSTGGLTSGVGNQRLALPLGGTSSFVQVTLNAPKAGTAWDLFIGCVDSTTPQPSTVKPTTMEPTPTPTAAEPTTLLPTNLEPSTLPPIMNPPTTNPPSPTPGPVNQAPALGPPLATSQVPSQAPSTLKSGSEKAPESGGGGKTKADKSAGEKAEKSAKA